MISLSYPSSTLMFFSINIFPLEPGLQSQTGAGITLDLCSGFFLKTNVFAWKEMDSFTPVNTSLISDYWRDFMNL